MKVGFTGTREGLTAQQHRTLGRILMKLAPAEFHHGACVGADEQAAALLDTLDMRGGCDEFAYPSTFGNLTSQNLHTARRVAKPKAALMRNRDIVRACDILIACPKEEEEVLQSGTWSTVRYCKNEHSAKPLILIGPDGVAYGLGLQHPVYAALKLATQRKPTESEA